MKIMTKRSVCRWLLSIATAFFLVASGSISVLPAAQADSHPKAPENPLTPTSVTADALPTVQINGVVWSQVVIGDVVYAGGSFTTARPAGAAAGQQTTVRNNILAYDIRTGELITSFAPSFNAQVLSLAASPDGNRLYIGGDFTKLNGQPATRMVALNPATGARIANFDPQPSNSVRAIVATNSVVYIGGAFFRLGEAWREQVAAVRTSDAGLLEFRPVVSGGKVDSLTLSPDGTKLAIGGQFTVVNATTENASGLAVVSTATGEKYAYPASTYVRNGGTTGSITSLASDEDTFYASGYTFGRSTTLEGVVAINWSDLGTHWLSDCHGDTYSVHASGGLVYLAGHPHYCGNIGGFAQEPTWEHYRAMALSKAVGGTISREIHGYTNFEGLPSPQLQTWFPALSTGKFTGQNQGPWSVSGNDDYIVYGGEFLRANYNDQQGLVRFTVRDKAPNARGPLPNAADFVPTLSSTKSGEVRVRWQAAADMDNVTLTYKVIRDGNNSNPVHEVTADSTFWKRQGMSFADKGLPPGSTHTYRIFVTDPTGRESRSTTESITVTSEDAPTSAYERVIKGDKPNNYWPIGADSGSTVVDAAGSDDLTLTGSASINGSNAMSGGAGGSALLQGGIAQNPTRQDRPNNFSTELWFKASSNQRGRLIGYGNGMNQNSTDHDRVTYLNNSGKLTFGVTERGTKRTITSNAGFTDNRWHHVVSTLGPEGMKLYVDGSLAASRTTTTTALELDGFWRLGQDRVNGWAAAPTSGFAGFVDEVAIYGRQLNAATIQNHYQAGIGQVVNVNPDAKFEFTMDGSEIAVDASASTDPDGTIDEYSWDFGDNTTAAGMTATHLYAAPGDYAVKLIVKDNSGATDQIVKTVTVLPAMEPNRPPTAEFAMTAAGLTVSVDGSTSSDPDGDELSYAWNFGDGSAIKGGANAEHTYANAGAYKIKLVVKDPDGLSDSQQHEIAVNIPPGLLAMDAFDRQIIGNWGDSDLGGAWTRTSSAATANVSGGSGKLIAINPGSGPAVYLPALTGTDAVATVQSGLDKASTGGGTYLSFSPRYLNASNQYYLKLQITSSGGAQIQLVRAVGGSETVLAAQNQPSFGYQAGTLLTAKISVRGTSPTQLAAKIWGAGASEPTDWQITATDSAESLQTPGGVGLRLYLSGSSTNAPMTGNFDNLIVENNNN